MSSYPETASFLSPEEKRVVLLANEADHAQKAGEHFDGKQIRSAFTDWRTWLWGVVYISIYIPVYSVILSLPTVVAGLGYKGTSATLMACPPYGLGFVIVLIAGWTADKYGRLFYHYLVGVVVTVVALIVLMVVKNLTVRYIMFFFVMFMYVPPRSSSVARLTQTLFVCASGSSQCRSAGSGWVAMSQARTSARQRLG